MQETNILWIDGYTLTHAVQRREAAAFLHHVERNMGWKTSLIIESLERQWAELDS